MTVVAYEQLQFVVPDVRVAGLRRSEVALLAGMSTDYYVRLQQGRDQHPSPQVLDALGRGRCNSTNTPPRTCTASPTRQQRGAARDRGPRRLLRASCS